MSAELPACGWRAYTAQHVLNVTLMLLLLSPAKTLDFGSPAPAAVLAHATTPTFSQDAMHLIEVLRTKSTAQVQALMELSPALAELNVQRYAAFRPLHSELNSKPAVLAFDGDVYDGLQARAMSLEQLHWAQEHLVILSGLYGALRPLDWMQPYRLEMGTSLATARGRDLYAFWGDRIAQYLNWRLRDNPSPVVLNLASQEYSRAALHKALTARVVECVFEDCKAGRYKVISFYAKRARGLMARWAIENKVTDPRQLSAFDAEGYRYEEALSATDRLVFRRECAT